MLDLAKYIYEAARNILNGSIKIYMDHLKGKRFLTVTLWKTSQHTIIGSLSLCEVNKIFKKLWCYVEVEYIKGNPKKVQQFKDNPAEFLIQEYDMKAKIVRE